MQPTEYRLRNVWLNFLWHKLILLFQTVLIRQTLFTASVYIKTVSPMIDTAEFRLFFFSDSH